MKSRILYLWSAPVLSSASPSDDITDPAALLLFIGTCGYRISIQAIKPYSSNVVIWSFF